MNKKDRLTLAYFLIYAELFPHRAFMMMKPEYGPLI